MKGDYKEAEMLSHLTCQQEPACIGQMQRDCESLQHVSKLLKRAHSKVFHMVTDKLELSQKTGEKKKTLQCIVDCLQDACFTIYLP